MILTNIDISRKETKSIMDTHGFIMYEPLIRINDEYHKLSHDQIYRSVSRGIITEVDNVMTFFIADRVYPIYNLLYFKN